MPPAILGPYTRTILTAAIIAAALGFSFTYARLSVYTELMPFFEWMETTWFGYVGKTWGAAFATIQAGHLIGLAVLGGCVIVGDGRLLGVLLTDVPHRKVIDRADRVFFLGAYHIAGNWCIYGLWSGDENLLLASLLVQDVGLRGRNIISLLCATTASGS